MTEPDPLSALLRESKAPEPGLELDERVLRSYRSVFPAVRRTAWNRFLSWRVSMPVPVLIAAAVIVALIFWFRSGPAPATPTLAPDVVTQLNVSGFQPLPNGEARVVSAKEDLK